MRVACMVSDPIEERKIGEVSLTNLLSLLSLDEYLLVLLSLSVHRLQRLEFGSFLRNKLLSQQLQSISPLTWVLKHIERSPV